MPKRVLDFDAMWGSDKLASCAEWAQAEYAWLYGLADASGCFEITNLRVIWGRVAAIRGKLTLERLEQVFAEFQEKGLLFVWEHQGKHYAHWTGSDVPGRLPPPSWRMRLERFAPPVPKQQLAQYMGRFARGRAALGGVGFRGAELLDATPGQQNFKFESADLREEVGRDPALKGARGDSFAVEERQGRNIAQRGVLKQGLEEGQGQDLDLVGDWDLVGDLVGDGQRRRDAPGNGVGDSKNSRERSNRVQDPGKSNSKAFSDSVSNPVAVPQLSTRFCTERLSARDLAVQRELRVGQGPMCAPGSVKAEVIERDRQRLAARAGSKGQ
jgi:hypothetical protein